MQNVTRSNDLQKQFEQTEGKKSRNYIDGETRRIILEVCCIWCNFCQICVSSWLSEYEILSILQKLQMFFVEF